MVHLRYKPNLDRYVLALAHTLPERWKQTTVMLNGARPISWIGGQLGLCAAEAVALAETVERDRMLVFLPYVTGECSPLGDPNIRACFFGLEDSASRVDICLSVVEAITFCFADIA